MRKDDRIFVIKYPNFTTKERKRLLAEYLLDRKNIDARNKFAEANMRLVENIGYKIFPELNESIRRDVEHEGLIGLLKAINKFDPSMGNEFSTYATPYIRQAMKRYFQKGGNLNIDLPVDKYIVRQKIFHLKSHFVKLFKRQPNYSDLAQLLDHDINEIIWYDHQLSSVNTGSLDDPVNEDEDMTVGDFVSSGEVTDKCLLPIAGQYITREELIGALNTLSPKSKQMLLLYVGGKTLEQIGEEFGISRERVRQINKNSIYSLRSYFGVNRKLPITFKQLSEKKEIEDNGYKFAPLAKKIVAKEKEMREEIKGGQSVSLNEGQGSSIENREADLNKNIPKLPPSLLKTAILILYHIPKDSEAELNFNQLGLSLPKDEAFPLYPHIKPILDFGIVTKKENGYYSWGPNTTVFTKRGKVREDIIHILPKYFSNLCLGIEKVYDLREIVEGITLIDEKPLTGNDDESVRPNPELNGSHGDQLNKQSSFLTNLPVRKEHNSMTIEETISSYRQYQVELDAYEENIVRKIKETRQENEEKILILEKAKQILDQSPPSLES
jgi:RNA polymerase sigma factor (sigma-70 family)